ncbi:NAD-dependent epimerase/dehydratase family protein [Cyclobacterium jeungdonense]|uniref:NAD-dependent epimerase/dehydratase family protein n=1 Tax=Cyclobacterium jeungdonense TaxID=708087 RepID=A0ABT8C987_9BACT|nr:NAD-dependent epimerase/dehydratase family protein [Cyclobacterium jeungdonense]MDN3688647.1 NAD-dependent epimerase/dehydratase family protein [Cyclobacterium jeungdonense]
MQTQTILGAGGNIGNGLAEKLSEFPVKVRLVSRNPKRLFGTEELVKADLLQASQVNDAVKGSDICYLVAGITYRAALWERDWPVIMKNVIAACKTHGSRLVFFDNMYAYDPKAVGFLQEDSPIRPESRKGKVRAEIAQMIMKEIEQGQLTAMIVRAADFYGPGARLSMVHETIINRMIGGKSPQWMYNKNKKHSFTYIPDATKATAFLAQQEDSWNQVWHLPTSKSYPSAQEIATILASKLDRKDNVQVLPGWVVSFLAIFMPLMKEIKELRYQLDEDYCFDSSKIETAYGLKPTSIDEGLQACIDH